MGCVAVSLLACLCATAPSGGRLFFPPEDMARLRAEIAEEGKLQGAWAKLLARADGLLAEKFIPEETAEAGAGQHGNYGAPSGQVARMGSTLGLAWAVTGERRYAGKLREALRYYAGYRRWAGKAFFSWDPPWHSELNTANFLYGYAVGMDLLGDFLSTEERKTLGDAVVRLGLRPTVEDWLGPARRVHALDSMGHNWWSVCVGAAGLAALALERDVPWARGRADQVAAAFPEWFAYRGNVLQNKVRSFDRRGGFYESVGYADYALRFFDLFRGAYRNARGAKADSLYRIEQLDGLAEFFLLTSYPTRDGILTVNFGDQDLSRPVSSFVILSAMEDCDARTASALKWYNETAHPEPRGIHELLLRAQGPPSRRPAHLPRARCWPDIGWAVLRDSWKDDATLLAVKCGDTWNHAHADAGSFLLWSGGKPLLIDSGTCTYGRREYTDYFRRSKAHNVVLLDGRGQMVEDIGRGSKFPGRIPAFLDGGDLRMLLADATGPTAHLFSRNYRTFLWAGGVILMVDELRAHEAETFQWLLHFDGKADLDAAERKVVVASGGASVAVRTLWPREVAYDWKEGLEDHHPDVKKPYLEIAAKEPSRNARFITALLPGPARERARKSWGLLEGPHFQGAAWQERGLRTEVYLNLRADGSRMHRNSNATLGGWETDAYLLVIQQDAEGRKEPGAPGTHPPPEASRIAALSCSYLRRGGRIYLDALAKVHVIWDTKSERPNLVVRTRNPGRLRIHAPAKPRAVVVNGRTVSHISYLPDEHLAGFALPRR